MRPDDAYLQRAFPTHGGYHLGRKTPTATNPVHPKTFSVTSLVDLLHKRPRKPPACGALPGKLATCNSQILARLLLRLPTRKDEHCQQKSNNTGSQKHR